MYRTVARYLALPLLSAGILGGAALGLAGTAAAAEMKPQPGIVATPQEHAQPAPEAVPGSQWHRHHTSLLDPNTAASFSHPMN